MKEFLKWWTKECETNIGKRFATPKMFAEGAWRAVLEMVLKNEDAYCCGDVDSEDVWRECPTKTFIKKELSNDWEY